MKVAGRRLYISCQTGRSARPVAPLGRVAALCALWSGATHVDFLRHEAIPADVVFF